MGTISLHLDRFLEPLARCFSPEVATKVAGLRADNTMQERIDYLAERANEGLLSTSESEEYLGCLRAIDVVAVLQAKARASLSQASH